MSTATATATLAQAQAASDSRTEAAGPSFYAKFKGMRLPLLMGRAVLINFIFPACSTVCLAQTLALADMQRQTKADLRRRMRLLSVSLDALSDTTQTLRAFAAKYQVGHAN